MAVRVGPQAAAGGGLGLRANPNVLGCVAYSCCLQVRVRLRVRFRVGHLRRAAERGEQSPPPPLPPEPLPPPAIVLSQVGDQVGAALLVLGRRRRSRAAHLGRGRGRGGGRLRGWGRA